MIQALLVLCVAQLLAFLPMLMIEKLTGTPPSEWQHVVCYVLIYISVLPLKRISFRRKEEK